MLEPMQPPSFLKVHVSGAPFLVATWAIRSVSPRVEGEYEDLEYEAQIRFDDPGWTGTNGVREILVDETPEEISKLLSVGIVVETIHPVYTEPIEP